MVKSPTIAKTDNPFFGLRASLLMMQEVSKISNSTNKAVVTNLLNNAWKECKESLDKRQLFFSLLFSFGDISNREHNIFQKKGISKPDAGGSGQRKAFLYCLEWLHANVPEQFYRFLPLYGEYYNLASMRLYELHTDRWKGTVTDTYHIPVDVDRFTDYIASVLKDPKTPENEIKLWAKWLWHIPSNTRTRKFIVTEKGLASVKKKHNSDAKVGEVIVRTGVKQSATVEKDKFAFKCINALCEKMGWTVRKLSTNTEYIGYRAFRSKYIAENEAVLFSTGGIRKYDEVQLLQWFDQLPSGARYRVQRRLVTKEGDTLSVKDKWINEKGANIGTIYLKWLNGKEEAQKAIRALSDEDKAKMQKEAPGQLKGLERAAKVHVGGESLVDAFVAMFKAASTTQEANLKAHSLLAKMKLEVPVLVCVDISGSMVGSPVTINGVSFTPNAFAKLLTTTFLLKNPDPELGDMFIRFDDRAEVIANDQMAEGSGTNRFMQTASTKVQNLIDRKADFVTNFNSVSKYIIGRNGTHFNVVADHLKLWVDAGGEFKSMRIEMINKYPVFLVISDSAFNSHEVPVQTVIDFQSKMRQWFGWEGVVVILDVSTGTQSNKFDGVQNVIHYSSFNPSVLNQVFTNIHNLDVIDVYSSLQALHRSNRYQPVQDLVV